MMTTNATENNETNAKPTGEAIVPESDTKQALESSQTSDTPAETTQASKEQTADEQQTATQQTSENKGKKSLNTLTQFLQKKYEALQALGFLGMVLPLFMAALILVALITGFFAYKFGVQSGLKQSAVVAVDETGKEITAEDIQSIALENKILKGEIQTLTKERDISLNNLNLVRDEIQELKENNSDLKTLTDNLSETLNLQSEIKGASADVVKMSINEIAVNEEDEATYEYHFDVVVPSLTEKHLVPKLTLLNSTSLVEIPLNPKSHQAKGVVPITGKFVMPKDFTPSQLRLDIMVDGEKIAKLYNWRVD